LPEQRDLTALRPLPGLTSRIVRALIACLACLALSSCFLKPHKIDIQQGNYIDPEAIAKLKPGMTRSQVRFLLGTPLLTDAFHPDRWDYLFSDRRAGKLMQEHRLTLWFEGDALKRAVTDTAEVAAPQPGAPAAGRQSAARTN
jgi:outer membrane protein assembly factor BamE